MMAWRVRSSRAGWLAGWLRLCGAPAAANAQQPSSCCRSALANLRPVIACCPHSWLGHRQHQGQRGGVRAGLPQPCAQRRRCVRQRVAMLCAMPPASLRPRLQPRALRCLASQPGPWPPAIPRRPPWGPHAPRLQTCLTTAGIFGRLPCNAFAFCPHDKCFEPDAHSHSKGDCWCAQGGRVVVMPALPVGAGGGRARAAAPLPGVQLPAPSHHA